MTRSRSPRARWPPRLEPFAPALPLPADIIRLAFNETSLGPFPAAMAAIAAGADGVHRYPQGDLRLIGRLAEIHGLACDMVALGNGADAIIGYICSAFLRPGDEAITGWPSFPTYATDAVKQEARVVTAPLVDGAVDLDAIADRIGPRTRLIWVCTPNNPTGGVVGPSAFRRFLDVVPDDVLVVVDEAYHEFSAGPDQLDAIAEHVRSRPNVAALRTFSKLYGLAGLRVGYLAAPEPVITAVAKSRHYYDVAELATVAALASLDCPEEVQRRRTVNQQRRAQLEAGLSGLGLRWFPSRANFLAVEVGDADAVAARLLAAGVATRSLSALDAPHLLRITVGNEADTDRVLELLRTADAPPADPPPADAPPAGATP